METIYFFIFCVGIAGIIFWALRYDDQADFTGQKRDEKFSTKANPVQFDDKTDEAKID